MKPAIPLVVLPQGNHPSNPLAWIAAIALVVVIVIAGACYEDWCAWRLRRRHAEFAVWTVHIKGATRYLMVGDTAVGLVGATGRGPRWPITRVRHAAAVPIRVPRLGAPREGLLLTVYSASRDQRFEMTFPHLSGITSPTNARAAVQAITAAKRALAQR